MRVLLTGGYGCIGSWLVRHLLERGDQVWIYDLKEDLRRLRMVLREDQLKQVPFIQGDVTDLEHLKTALREQAITHVVHLAGLQVPTCRANPILGAKVNVAGNAGGLRGGARAAGAGAAADLRQLRRRIRAARDTILLGRWRMTCR